MKEETKIILKFLALILIMFPLIIILLCSCMQLFNIDGLTPERRAELQQETLNREALRTMREEQLRTDCWKSNNCKGKAKYYNRSWIKEKGVSK